MTDKTLIIQPWLRQNQHQSLEILFNAMVALGYSKADIKYAFMEYIDSSCRDHHKVIPEELNYEPN